MSGSRVIILADGRDSHVPLVTRHLADEPVFIDTGRMGNAALSYDSNPDRIWPRILYNGELLGPVRSVWNRSQCAQTLFATGEPVAADPLHPVTVTLTELLQEPVKWVSARDAVIGATSLVKQQAAARQVGFRVPPTLVTADLDLSRQFVERHQRCTVKPLVTGDHRDPNRFAVLVRRSDDIDIASLPGPFRILQAYTEPVSELRVVVVGRTTFAAIISNPVLHLQRPPVRHWRVDVDPTLFVAAVAPLPERVALRCVRLVRALGLETAVIDLAVEKHQLNHTMQSVHPNGNWDFLQTGAGLPIGAAMAQLLVTK